jgi:hypothetical protein
LNFRKLMISELAALTLVAVVYGSRISCVLTLEDGPVPFILTSAIVFGVILVSVFYGCITAEDQVKAVIILIPLATAALAVGLGMNDTSFAFASSLIAAASSGITIPLMRYCPDSLKIFSSLTAQGIVIFALARYCHLFLNV